MLPAQSKEELYISVRRISEDTGIHAYRFEYHAKKMQLRTFKIKGRRMIEVSHAIYLLEWFQKEKRIDTQAEVQRLTEIKHGNFLKGGASQL